MPEDSFILSRAILHSYCIHNCPKIFLIQKPTKLFSGISVSKGRVSLLWTTIFQRLTLSRIWQHLCHISEELMLFQWEEMLIHCEWNVISILCYLSWRVFVEETFQHRKWEGKRKYLRDGRQFILSILVAYSPVVLMIDIHGEICRTIEEELRCNEAECPGWDAALVWNYIFSYLPFRFRIIING